jgi:polyhydroxyalkanoate synthase
MAGRGQGDARVLVAHWIEWLKARSGGQVPARDPAKGKLKPLGDAPGTYVKVRS